MPTGKGTESVRAEQLIAGTKRIPQRENSSPSSGDEVDPSPSRMRESTMVRGRPL